MRRFLLTSPVKCLILQHIPELMAKGRDKNLIELRDEALCRRYYYWTEVQRLRFDDALKVLSGRSFHFRGADHVHYPAQVSGTEGLGGEARPEG